LSTLYDPTDWQAGTTPFSQGNMNKIEQGIRQAVPVGFIGQWPLPDPPPGWLLCDGSEVSRATYPELWDWVNSNGLVAAGLYGNGNGATTFSLPDGRGRFPRSPSSGLGGAIGGAADHAHTNPTTGSAGSHSHTNSATSPSGGHSHTNSNTGGGIDDFIVDLVVDTNGDGSIASIRKHHHSLSNTGSVAAHSHAVPPTSTQAAHQHAQGATTTQDNLPPYLELWMIVAT
jgi:microcystin-dependent protein